MKLNKYTTNVNWLAALEKSKIFANNLRKSNIEGYLASPTKCKRCNIILEYDKRINAYCSRRCSALNRKLPFSKKCLVCDILIPNSIDCCSRTCDTQYKYLEYIRDWKLGIKSGLGTSGVVTQTIKKYLREKYNNKCCLCGWAKINIHTNKVPLVADHIDGNWKNNTEDNLQLICSNCDSLQSTYEIGRASCRERV